MLELGQLDLEEIATALSDQTDYDHRWLIDPESGQVAFWTSDTGIDGENPVELEDVIGRPAAHDVADPKTGEVLLECNEVLTPEKWESLKKIKHGTII